MKGAMEPIRDKKKIDAMKAILASGKYGQRNLVLFRSGSIQRIESPI